MKKCVECKRYKHRLACLKCEQQAEANHEIILPEIIKPMVKDVPLEDLKDRQKAVLILRIIGEMSYRRIASLFNVSHPAIMSWHKKASNRIKKLKKP